MLRGHDVSNFQGVGTVANAKALDFVIVKASEGLNFTDRMHDVHVAEARARKALVGHYHFARVNAGASAQAAYFLQRAKAVKGDVLVLDFEPYGQVAQPSSYARWIIEFADAVRGNVGVDPWLYMDDNMLGALDRWASSAEMSRIRQLPLWKASYTSQPGSLHGWSALTAWQFTDKPIDTDQFFGDAGTWRSLAIGGNASTVRRTVARDLQSALNELAHAGLVVDGIVGPATKRALNTYLAGKGPFFAGKAELVKAMQKYVNGFAFTSPKLVVDGVFGPMSKAAVLFYINRRNGGFTNSSY